MDYWLLVFYVMLGCMTGAVISAAVGEVEDNVMCSGVPVVVKTADTIRTFSCTVELKSKENK